MEQLKLLDQVSVTIRHGGRESGLCTSVGPNLNKTACEVTF